MNSLFRFALIAALGYGIYVVLFGTPDLKAPAQVEIPKGAGVSDIADKLKEADIIRSKFGFETLVWLMRASSKLQAGEYKFEAKDFKLADIVRILTRGLGAINEREITVIEGWGVDEIGTYLEAQGMGTKREFFEVVGNMRRPDLRSDGGTASIENSVSCGSLVVCGVGETITRFSPRILFSSEDFPTFGLPIIATRRSDLWSVTGKRLALILSFLKMVSSRSPTP